MRFRARKQRCTIEARAAADEAALSTCRQAGRQRGCAAKRAHTRLPPPLGCFLLGRLLLVAVLLDALRENGSQC